MANLKEHVISFRITGQQYEVLRKKHESAPILYVRTPNQYARRLVLDDLGFTEEEKAPKTPKES